MAMKLVYLQGKAKWTNKLFVPDQQYKCWSMVLYPNAASYDKILELKKGGEYDGILNVIKKDDDGYYVTLKRPTEKVIKGKVQAFQSPIVTNADGSPLINVSIGNGSDVTAGIEFYTYPKPTGGKRGSAIRLLTVRVDNLIPYEKSDRPPEVQKTLKGLDEQPEQLF